MSHYIRLVASLSKLCGIVAAVMILASVIVVCQMVVIRYVLEESSYWQTEFVTYALIAATFVGAPYVLLTRGHVNVDLLPMYLGHRGRMVLALLAAVLSLLFCVIMTWTGYDLLYEAWDNNWVSDTIWGVRLWIPYLAMPVGFGIMALQYVADILSLLRGEDMPFGIKPEEGL
jgi:TRAP-type C4-dicarboxylate transport system permease small subunit